MINLQAISHSHALLSPLKCLLNEIWNNDIWQDRNEFCTLIEMMKDKFDDDDKFYSELGFKNKAIFNAKITLLETLLNQDTQIKNLHFSDIGLALWIKAQNEDQKHFAHLILKLDHEAEQVWLNPQDLPEIRAEKVDLLVKKIYQIGEKSHLQFKRNNSHQQKLIAY